MLGIRAFNCLDLGRCVLVSSSGGLGLGYLGLEFLH